MLNNIIFGDDSIPLPYFPEAQSNRSKPVEWVSAQLNRSIKMNKSNDPVMGSRVSESVIPSLSQVRAQDKSRMVDCKEPSQAFDDESKVPCLDKMDDAYYADFKMIADFASKIVAARTEDGFIRCRACPNLKLNATLMGAKRSKAQPLRLLIEVEPQSHQQTIIVDDQSPWRDRMGEIAGRYHYDKHIGAHVHAQYNKEAIMLFDHLKQMPGLKQHQPTMIIGHSGGGAIANLLQLHLRQAGYANVQAVTFGQPKVINQKGAERFEKLPLLRVVSGEDQVPRLSPARVNRQAHHAYTHMGMEMLIEDDRRFQLLEGEAVVSRQLALAARSLSQASIAAHDIEHYVKQVAQMPLLGRCVSQAREDAVSEESHQKQANTEMIPLAAILPPDQNRLTDRIRTALIVVKQQNWFQRLSDERV